MTLTDGRTFDQGAILFQKTTYHFFGPDGEDLTSLITRADKLKFSGFDPSVDNERLYQEQYQAQHGGAPAPKVGPTSTSELFTEYLAQDVRNIAGAALQPVQQASRDLLVIAALGALAYFAFIRK